MSISQSVRLKEGERIIVVVRHFLFVYTPSIIVALLLISAPLFFMVPLFSFGWPGMIGFGALILAGVLYGSRILVDWYGNAFIINNRRIIDVDQDGFFARHVCEAYYEKIQDVSYRVSGFWGTVFRYGTIVVQTAGTSNNLELHFVRRPREVQHLITETMAEFVATHSGQGERVSALLDAAANLTDVEARAFLVELKEAINRQEEDEDLAQADDADVERLMGDGEGSEEMGDRNG